jgi:hypothetical protein
MEKLCEQVRSRWIPLCELVLLLATVMTAF